MPVQRKVFRIELTKPMGAPEPAAPGSPPAGGAVSALHHQQILTELQALRDLIERRCAGATENGAEQVVVSALRQLKDETDAIHRAINRTKEELATLHGGFNGAGSVRAARELDAVVDDTERATQQILSGAEQIDEAVKSLSAFLKRGQEQVLAQEIRDHVVRIFEACNFQDLSGQRITKVLATLKFVEEHVARMMEIWGGQQAFETYAAGATAERDNEAKLVNGPKLDDDPGHASQEDIDAMFA
jgi:chemotaxis protein CheZ